MLFGTWSQVHAYDPSDYMETRLKPGLHISRKDHKHLAMNMYLSCTDMVDLYIVVMVTSFDISQEIFSSDMLTALKSSLKHRRKHVLRSFRQHRDQALTVFSKFLLDSHDFIGM